MPCSSDERSTVAAKEAGLATCAEALAGAAPVECFVAGCMVLGGVVPGLPQLLATSGLNEAAVLATVYDCIDAVLAASAAIMDDAGSVDSRLSMGARPIVWGGAVLCCGFGRGHADRHASGRLWGGCQGGSTRA